MYISNLMAEQYVDVLSSLNETGKLGYAIARNSRKLRETASDYIKIKNDLLQKYGELSEDKTTLTVPESKRQEYLSELGDIPLIEHDVDIYKVTEETFFGGSLTSQQMEILLWMVEESN